MVTALKPVGFFREVRERLGEDVSGLPSLQDAVRPAGHADEDRIVAYLEEGVCLAACAGVMPDVLAPSAGVMTSSDFLTDGVWLWPGELAHYVDTHHVALPIEFAADMRRNGWSQSLAGPRRPRCGTRFCVGGGGRLQTPNRFHDQST